MPADGAARLSTNNFQLKPRIALTLGDPAGIGPEIIASALASDPFPLGGPAIEVIGSSEGHVAGAPTDASARASLDALEEAVTRTKNGEFSAVVTGPVSKHHLHQIGFEFPGQTEFFAARTATADHAMCLTGGALTVALVTAHLPLAAVAPALTTPEIVRVGKLLATHCHHRGIDQPRIAVAGLNPHAGENGDLGSEEIEIIAPAVSALVTSGITADFAGPLPPDTVFFRAVEGDFDAVLCMYHDQGLIPLKLHAFHEGVNVTLGLPFPRTSPDHGTAFDIAGQGIARPDSLIAALRLAAELAASRSSPATE
ncbi:MAG: 4-hydroxythreonine-4-phosphate dehydrogenase PdxA [Chthoniobacterales bacterium]